MNEYYYNIQPKSVTVHFADGDAFVFPADHRNFDKVRRALSDKRPASEIKELTDVLKAVKAGLEAPIASGLVKADRNGVTYRDRPIDGSVVERIKEHIAEGLDVKPLINFLEKLLQNHRREAVLSLYDFLAVNNIPLTEDGDFITYKKVREDYRDIHSGTFDNSVGMKPRVEPWEVEADRSQTCAKGLHVCSRSYLPHFGGSGSRVVICKVNPADVVAVPNDYNNAKMRVCGYEVIGEIDSSRVAELLDSYRIVNSATSMDGVSWGDNFTDDPADDEDYENYEDEDDIDTPLDDFDDERIAPDTPPAVPEPTVEQPTALPPQRGRFTWFGRS